MLVRGFAHGKICASNGHAYSDVCAAFLRKSEGGYVRLTCWKIPATFFISRSKRSWDSFTAPQPQQSSRNSLLFASVNSRRCVVNPRPLTALRRTNRYTWETSFNQEQMRSNRPPTGRNVVDSGLVR